MKRQSDHQITKDDADSDNGDAEIEESKRATAEVISQRRIVKARRPGASAVPAVAPAPQISFSMFPSTTQTNVSLTATAPSLAPATAAPTQEKEHDHENSHHEHHKHDKDTATSEQPEKKNEEGSSSAEAKTDASVEASKEETTKETSVPSTAPKLSFSGFLSKPTTSFGFGLSTPASAASPTVGGSPTASAGGAFLSWASKPVVSASSNPMPSLSSSSSSIFASFGGASNATTSTNNNDEDNEDGDENGDETVTEHASDAIFAKVVDLPETVELQTGEEDESSLLQLRVKLYRWNRDTSSSSSSSGNSQEEDHGKDLLGKVDGVEAVHGNSNVLGTWVEVGVGPLKVLRDKNNEKKSRLVVRREEKIGGSGTKVLLNAALKQYVTVSKHSETVVRINCINHANDVSEVKMNTYNIRTKLSSETNELYDILVKCIEAGKE